MPSSAKCGRSSPSATELTAYFEWLDGPRPKPDVVPAGAEVKAMVPRFRIEMLLTRRRLLKAELAKTTDNFEKLHMELADVEHELAEAKKERRRRGLVT